MCHGVRLGEMCMIVEQCYLAECQHQVARDPSHKLLSTSRNYKGQGCSLRQTNQGLALSLPPKTSKVHTYREDNYHCDITTVCGGEVRNIGSCPIILKRLLLCCIERLISMTQELLVLKFYET